MNKPERTIYHFGPFRLDATRRLLMRGGKVVSLPPKAFELLLLLIRHQGEVLDKESLMKGVWPDVIVEENNLTVIVSALRKALGETPTEHRYILTLSGRGYSFVAEASEVVEEAATWPANERVHSLAGDDGGVRARNDRDLHRPFPATQLGVQSIAVLPFKALGGPLGGLPGGEEQDGYLGLGIADALITQLGNLRQMIVRPTTAVLRYAGPDHDLPAIGRELGVEALLDGHIQRAGTRVRVTVQLIRVSDGAPLWSEKFDEQFTNIFDVQDAISPRRSRAHSH